MLRYSFTDSDFSVVISDEVLAHFESHRQIRFYDKEAGGQLFAHFNNAQVLIEKATGPRPTDKITRTSYQPDRRAEQVEIQQMFDSGFHFVGDWHTHPSFYPKSSGIDVSNIKSCVKNSTHELKGFIMIVVGTASFPAGLFVSFHDGNKEYVLKPVAEKT